MDTPDMEVGRESVMRDCFERGSFQSVLAEVSSRFLCVSDEGFDAAAQYALQQLGELFGMDRSYIFHFFDGMARMRNTHEWCAPGVSPQKESLQNISTATVPWWIAAMRTLRPLCIPDVNAMPPVARAEKRILRAQGIQSLICLPLQNHQAQLIGFMGLDAVSTSRSWSDSEISMLQVLSEIVAGAIDRHDMERALKSNDLRFTQLAELGRVMVWEVDAEGLYTYVSPTSDIVVGYKPEELVGWKYFYDLHPAEGVETFKKEAFENFQRREPFRHFLNPAIMKDGRAIWLSTSGLPIMAPDGRLVGYRGSDSDVTAQKEAEDALARAQAGLEARVAERTEALRESEERYRRVLQATRSFLFTVWLKDGQEMRTVHDPTVEEVTGYAPSAYEQDPLLWHRMIHPEDLARVNEYIARVRSGDAIATVEHRILHQDGSVRWVRNTSVTRKGPAGELLGYDGLITDISELKCAEIERDEVLATLNRMATHDSMTGLHNRRGFKKELQHLWSMAQRHPMPIGLLIVDLDHFKSINDTHGHLVGDLLIKEYAALIQSLVREADTVCRYAGDELVIILPWADRKDVCRTGERILEQVRAYSFCKGEHDLRLTVSIGAYALTPHPRHAMERLMVLTDRALYRAKQTGRDRLCYADDADESSDLSKAVDVDPVSDVSDKGVVLVVDDEPVARATFVRLLEEDGYRVRSAATIDEAMAWVQREQGLMDVALVDILLREESGLDLIGRIRLEDELLVPLAVTGQATIDTAIEALRSGAFDFLQKPLTLSQLSVLMKRAMNHRRLLLENRRYQNHLEAMVRQKGQSLSRALDKEKRSHQFALEAMASLIGTRELETGEHSRRVARIAVILAEEMGATKEELEDIRNGALLHDIGKVGIPDAILLKPGPLTEEEWDVIRTHPQMGHQIIASSPALKGAAEIVLTHQERFDGSGYPCGLAGDKICLGSRIFSVVDAYDAIRSVRPYAPSRTPEEALDEIRRHAGTQFDPAVVSAFIRCQSKIEAEGGWSS